MLAPLSNFRFIVFFIVFLNSIVFTLAYLFNEGLLDTTTRTWNIPGLSYIDPLILNKRELLFQNESMISSILTEFCSIPTQNSFLSSGAWVTTLRSGYSQSATNLSLLYNAHDNTMDVNHFKQDSINYTSITTPRTTTTLPTTKLYNKKGNRSASFLFRSHNTPPRQQSFKLEHDYLFSLGLLGDSIGLLYTNDNRYIWGSSFTSVFKIKRHLTQLELVDFIRYPGFLTEHLNGNVFHGAYSILSFENIFYTLRGNRLEAYGDSSLNDTSKITKLSSIDLMTIPFNNQGTPHIEHNNQTVISVNDRYPLEDLYHLKLTHMPLLNQPDLLHPLKTTNRSNEFLSYSHRDTFQQQRHSSVLMMNEKDDQSLFVGRALCMLHDGTIIIVTNHGYIASTQASRTNGFYKMTPWIQLSPYRNETLTISNGIACDQYSGIYVVTNKYVHKIQWNGTALIKHWDTIYSMNATDISFVRLGEGSGSSPTLMEGPTINELYVVITDNMPIMNIAILDANNGQIVARQPVTFGDNDIKETISEQSVLVMGNRLAVVNNTPKNDYIITLMNLLMSKTPTFLKPAFNALPTVLGDAPKGIQQFQFNFETKELKTTWINRDVAIPNSIPAGSCIDGMLYGIGRRLMKDLSNSFLQQRISSLYNTIGGIGPLFDPGPLRGIWTLEGVDWLTGQSLLRYSIGGLPIYNSLYAATEIGPGNYYWYYWGYPKNTCIKITSPTNVSQIT